MHHVKTGLLPRAAKVALIISGASPNKPLREMASWK
jgi:hypothetical protein